MVLFTSSRASSQPPDPDAKHTEPGPPVVSAGEEGFVIQSPTGDYRLQFGLLLQADGRFDAGDDDGEEVDTFALRRVRPQLRGRIAQRFEFFLNPDFAGGTLVLQDAYIDTRFSPAFIVRLGKGKTPFGLERLTSAGTLAFLERALPNALVPNRDVGVQVFGEIPGGIVSYAAAVLNGVADGGSGDVDTNDGKDLVGRIVIRPFPAPAEQYAERGCRHGDEVDRWCPRGRSRRGADRRRRWWPSRGDGVMGRPAAPPAAGPGGLGAEAVRPDDGGGEVSSRGPGLRGRCC